MAQFSRIPNPNLVSQGMTEYGDRPVMPPTINEEILEPNQQVTDGFWENAKIRNLSVDKLLAGSIKVTEYLQSTGFVTGTTGWRIDGLGNAEFATITLTGGTIRYGKTSLSDSTHAGYWISSDGFYFGSASDVSYIKYNLSAATLTGNVIGNFKTAYGTGERIEVTDTAKQITYFDSANHPRLTVGATATTNVFYIDDDSNTVYPSIDIRRSVGTGAGIYIECASPSGHCFEGHNHSDTPVFVATAQYSGSPTYSVPYLAEQMTATSTNFYKEFELQGSTVANARIWLANNVSPNGSLSGTKGDFCISTNGSSYQCQGGSAWSLLGGGIIASLTVGEAVSANDCLYISTASADLFSPWVINNTRDSTMNFGLSTAGSQKLAQSVTGDGNSYNTVLLTVGPLTPTKPTDDLRISIQADSGGNPSGVNLATGTVACGLNIDIKTVTLNANVNLTAASTFWIVVSREGALNDSEYFGADTRVGAYAGGFVKAYVSNIWYDPADGRDFVITLKNLTTVGEAYKTDSDTAAFTTPFIGFAFAAAAEKTACNIQVCGVMGGFTGLSPSSVYYVNATPGTIGTSAGGTSKKVGRALSATQLLIGSDTLA